MVWGFLSTSVMRGRLFVWYALDMVSKQKRRILVILLAVILVLGAGLFFAARKSRSACPGTDTLGKDGLCVVDTEGGCRYDPGLGPKAALC